MKDNLIDAMQEVVKDKKLNKKFSGISTEFNRLDEMLSGLNKHNLIIIGSATSMGKTALALNIALNSSKHNKVLYLTLAETANELTYKIMSICTGISTLDIGNGCVTTDQYVKIANTCKKLNEHNLLFEDITDFRISNILETVKRNKGIDLLIIDYLQLLESDSTHQNRHEELTVIIRKIKQLAKDLNIPIIIVSQLSRKISEREDKRPRLSDLKDSGSIEQDADSVILLHRAEYYLERGMPAFSDAQNPTEWLKFYEEVQNTAELIVAKNRNGCTGTIALHCEKPNFKFKEIKEEFVK